MCLGIQWWGQLWRNAPRWAGRRAPPGQEKYQSIDKYIAFGDNSTSSFECANNAVSMWFLRRSHCHIKLIFWATRAGHSAPTQLDSRKHPHTAEWYGFYSFFWSLDFFSEYIVYDKEWTEAAFAMFNAESKRPTMAQSDIFLDITRKQSNFCISDPLISIRQGQFPSTRLRAPFSYLQNGLSTVRTRMRFAFARRSRSSTRWWRWRRRLAVVLADLVWLGTKWRHPWRQISCIFDIFRVFWWRHKMTS